MKTLNLSISSDLLIRLGDFAERTGRSKTYCVLAALEEKLAEREDYKLALKSVKEMELKKSRTWTHKEIEEGRDLL